MSFRAPIPFLTGNSSAPSLPTLILFVVNLQAHNWFHWNSQKMLGKTKSSKSGLSGWSANWMLGVSRQSSLDERPSFYNFISHSAMEDGYLQMNIQMHTTTLAGDHGFNFNAFSEYSDNTIWSFFPLILHYQSITFRSLFLLDLQNRLERPILSRI